jgi:hypothetical protein
MSDRFSPEQRADIIRKVIEGLRAGTPLTVICSADGMPCDDTVRNWADEDPQVARDIARARETGFDTIATEVMSIIDTAPERVITNSGEGRTESRIDSASVQWAKNRAETRLKLLAKWDPKRYGEATLMKHADPDGNALPSISVTLVRSDKE